MPFIIPNPKRYDDVARNQYMIPRCYMKSWGWGIQTLVLQ